MKKISIKAALLFIAMGLNYNAFSQGGPKWGLNGNSVGTSDFLGATNNAPLIFVTNGSEAARVLGNGNIGIGTTTPTEKLEVNGNIRAMGNLFANSVNVTGPAFLGDVTANRVITFRIIAPNDEIHFGDSSVVISTANNTVYASGVSTNGNNGLGLGSASAIGKAQGSVAIGFVNQTDASFSTAIGSFLQTGSSSFGSVVIGRGISFGQRLTNNISNSLCIGFNSDVPTFFVGPSGGIGQTGNVGIGTTSPGAKLTVNAATSAGIQTILSGNNADLTKAFTVTNTFTNKENFTVFGDGRVAIGAPLSLPAGYKLYVTGGILTERCRVAVDGTSDWADYVFNTNYKLMSLEDLETYVRKYKHLPGVPSAKEVVSQGVDVTKMFAILLEKIEENSLYIIELKKENETLKKEIEKTK